MPENCDIKNIPIVASATASLKGRSSMVVIPRDIVKRLHFWDSEETPREKSDKEVWGGKGCLAFSYLGVREQLFLCLLHESNNIIRNVRALVSHPDFYEIHALYADLEYFLSEKWWYPNSTPVGTRLSSRENVKLPLPSRLFHAVRLLPSEIREVVLRVRHNIPALLVGIPVTDDDVQEKFLDRLVASYDNFRIPKSREDFGRK